LEFELRIIDLHWIDGSSDYPDDLCLHGHVFVRIGEEVLDDGTSDGWTVSAGAYQLLKSAYEDHIADDINDIHLLPCCGDGIWIDETTDKLRICGCISGLDWSVTHEGGAVRLTTGSNTQVILSLEEYRTIVFQFADAIQVFYETCSPKSFFDEVAEQGYHRFWTDWTQWREDVRSD